jgi:hypothetical protein
MLDFYVNDTQSSLAAAYVSEDLALSFSFLVIQMSLDVGFCRREDFRFESHQVFDVEN